MPLFEVAQKETENIYTKKSAVPQYTPSAVAPPITGLCDYSKYTELIRDIDKSNVTDEEKKFLKFAATRHIVFTYSRIADYYAHATPEMQRLMEKSALVIVDIDDAIANGYVKLSKDIEKIMQTSGEKTGEK